MISSVEEMYSALALVESDILKCQEYVALNPNAIDVQYSIDRIPELTAYAEHIQNGIEAAISSMED
jgi:hypothetical protein